MILNAANLAILSQSVQTVFARGLERKVTPWEFLAMTVPSTTAESVYPFLKELGNIREWVGDREIQNIAQGNMKIANRDFEETHGIPRNAIDDDSYGVYSPVFEQTGQNVAAFPADQVFAQLKAGSTTLGPDGQYFFDVDHPVGNGVVSNDMGGAGDAWYIVDSSKVFKPIIWQPRRTFELVRLFSPDDPNVFFKKQFIWGVDGRAGVGYSPFWQLAFRSAQPLTDANVEAAMTAMASQRGESGKPLKIAPTHFVCGPAIGEAAKKMFARELLAGGGSNTLHNRLEVVVAGELL